MRKWINIIKRAHTPSIIREMRTDSEAFDRLDDADKWLARYTYDNLDKWPSRETISELLRRYPNQEAMTLYRGMNFRTEDEFIAFKDDLKDGSVPFNGISSWTTTRESAWQFAVVRPTYYPDRETFQQEKLAREQGEELRGFMGIILKTRIGVGQGIDVNKSDLGHEDEIILPPGSFAVEIEYIRRFHDQIEDGSIKIENFILGLKSAQMNREESALLHHILLTKADRLTVPAQNHLFSLYGALDQVETDYEDRRNRFGTQDGYTGTLFFYFNRQLFDWAEKGYFGKQNMPAVRQAARKVWRAFLNEAQKYPNAYIEARDIGQIAKLAGETNSFQRFMKERFATRYHAMNSREELIKVKTRDDIDEFKKKMETLFKQMAELKG